MPSGIYQILCTANGKVYIGSAADIHRRWRQHQYRLRRGVHANPHLQSAWSAYGEASFVFQVAEECGIGELLTREQQHLDSLPWRASFNIRRVAGGNRGNKWSAEARAKIAGRRFSEKAIRRRAEVGLTPFQRERIRMGRLNGKRGTGRPKGFHHSEETRRKISDAHCKRKERDLLNGNGKGNTSTPAHEGHG